MGTKFEDLEKKLRQETHWYWRRNFLHIFLVGLVLMAGLSKRFVKPSTEPLELVILQDIKPPEPEPPKEDSTKSHLKWSKSSASSLTLNL